MLNQNRGNTWNGKNRLPIEPIDCDVLIIDEASMVDVFLMNYILKRDYI